MGATMRAVLVHQPGGPEALDYVEVPMPELPADSLLVRAEAFGVGQPDMLIRTGVYKWMPPLPANPGNDAAGRIVGVGGEVQGLTVGQKVVITARDLPRRGGCYAEFLAVPADAVHVVNEGVDLCEAVCLSNYQAAWALLHDAPGGTKPRTILVIGAAGGVGSAIVQLAKLEGIRVIGTVSSQAKAEFARAMGADDIIFYRDEDVIARTGELTRGRGVDLILDHVGGPDFTSYFKILDKWGMVISYNAFAGLPGQNLMAEMRQFMAKCPAVRSFSFHIYDDDPAARRMMMRTVIGHLEARRIKPAIFTKLNLSEVRRAHALLDAGAALGKIVMTAV